MLQKYSKKTGKTEEKMTLCKQVSMHVQTVFLTRKTGVLTSAGHYFSFFANFL